MAPGSRHTDPGGGHDGYPMSAARSIPLVSFVRRRLALVAVTMVLLASAADARAQSTCSAPGQPPCCFLGVCTICDPGLVLIVFLNQCSDSDGFPVACGGEGERPCTVLEHIPSCKSGLFEIPFPGGNCTRLDSDGFPTFCGGEGERPCAINEHIPSCKSGLFEIPFPGGNCTRLDSDGFPPFCGGVDERACAVNEHIPSCKSGLIEERGNCRAIDTDGFPTSCGGDGEPGCEITVQVILGITSCKGCHVEIPAAGGTCRAVKDDRYPAVCGACNQVPCDITTQAQLLQASCKPGLTESGGLCKRLDANGTPITCAGLGEPDLATTAGPPAPSPGQEAWGYADLHTHPFSNIAFGGLTVWGEPFDANGIGSALPHCDYACGFRAIEANGTPIAPAAFPLPPGVPVHGPFGTLDLFGIAGSDDLPLTHGVGGYPAFDGWPRHHRISHQQMYHRWIERAWRGGLRLMVTHAVNNEVLCRLSKRREGFACEDMPTVDRQIQAVKDLEAFIDQKSGGPGQGWFRIATSAAHARQILDEGKLVVVLGIEVDSLFGCGLNASCTAAGVRDDLAAYHAMGVRHILPIHLFDNAFGGTAIYEDNFNIANLVLSNQFLAAEDCSQEGVEFHLSDLGEDPMSVLIRTVAGAVLGITIPPATYPPGGHCNARGLTPLGESLVKLIMGRGMILDLDHMSYRATDRALEIAVDEDYPVVVGHARFQETLANDPNADDHLKAEYAKLRRHVEAIRDLGGLVAPLLHQGEAHAMQQVAQVPSDCSNSTKTWAQAYLYAVEQMSTGSFHQAVALGSDFNGGISQVGPRLGPLACQGESHPDQGGGINYAFPGHGIPGQFEMSASGSMAFDYNEVGLAHVGLFPDFIEDLKAIGLTDGQIEPLFRSAEAYVDLWERIEAGDHFPPVTAYVPSPPPNAAGWHNTEVDVALQASPDPDGWEVAEVHAQAGGAQTIPPFSASGSEAQLDVVVEGATTITFHAEDEAGNEEEEKTATVLTDWTPPALAWSGGGGTHTVADFLDLGCTASDALSGIASSTCLARVDPAYHFPPGLNTITAEVTDLAGNEATADVSFTVIVDFESLSNLVSRIVAPGKAQKFLLKKLAVAEAAGADVTKKEKQLTKFQHKVANQAGRAVATADAPILIALADAL